MNRKKACIIICAFVTSTCLFVPQKITTNKTRWNRRALRLVSVQEKKDETLFKSIVDEMAHDYGTSNPRAFLSFLNTKNRDGVTPLMYAVAASDQNRVKFIMEKAIAVLGHDPQLFLSFISARDPYGNSAFYLASQIGDRNVLATFLDCVARGLEKNKQLFAEFILQSANNSGWTALHDAAYNSSSVAAQLIVEKSRELLTYSSKNLVETISEKYDQIINAKDEDNGTPLAYAQEPSMRLFLQNNGGTVYEDFKKRYTKALAMGSKLIEAVQENDFELFQKIIQDAADRYKDDKRLFVEFASQRDSFGWSALMHAAAHGKTEFLRYFLDQIGAYFGRDSNAIYNIINNVAHDGKNVLILAIFRREFEAAQLILRKIDEYIKNRFFIYVFLNSPEHLNGFTPLFCAVYNSSDEEGFYLIIKLLLEVASRQFGKDSYAFYHFINMRDNYNHTPLAYAKSRIKSLLESYGAIDIK